MKRIINYKTQKDGVTLLEPFYYEPMNKFITHVYMGYGMVLFLNLPENWTKPKYSKGSKQFKKNEILAKFTESNYPTHIEDHIDYP